MQLAKLKEREKAVVEYAAGKNALLAGKAVELLSGQGNFREIIDELLGEGSFVIDFAAVEKKLLRTKIDAGPVKKAVVERKRFRPAAKETEANFRVLKQYDVTGQSRSEGKVKDFLQYFQRKFELLSGILRKRHTISPKPIRMLRAVPKGSKVDVIGMVLRKWVSKNGNIVMELEDLDSKCIALVLKDDLALTAMAEHIMNDDVIGVRAVKWNEGMLILKEILQPDMPIRERKEVESGFAVASISDVHIGSKLFLEKPFNSFLQWLNGKGIGAREREKVSRIKYLVVTGDNIDGIGVYPNQFQELNIKDMNEQYEEFSKFILQVPEYIEVVICPGQHDAVRRADPQPAIPKEFAPELHKMRNVHFVGSPSWVEIEGLKTLIYHGAALHDLISSVGFLDSEKPQDAMIEVLKRRDIMAAYGMKQPYVPEKEDFMVIRQEPDLVYIGDMHHNGYGNYRGATIINSGTWQARTGYQAKLGHVPTPGIVPVLELATGKITEKRFLGAEENALQA